MIHLRPVVTLIVTALVASIVTACNRQSGASTPSPGTTAPGAAATSEPPKPVPEALPGVLARVNDETVSKAEFEEALATIEQRGQGPVPTEERDRVYRGILDQLIGLKLLGQEVAARKVTVPDADVDARMAQMRQQFPDENVFAQAMKAQGKTLDGLKADARRGLAITKLIDEALAGKTAVAPTQAQEFYDKNPDQFARPEQVRASHILIAVDEKADSVTKGAARDRAERVLKQVKAGGNFAALAKEHSQDPGSAANGGDLGLFPKGQMVPPFDKVAFALAPGATSDLVETQFGFHIIRVAEKQPGGKIPLDEVRGQLEQYLESQNRQRELAAFVQTLRAQGKVQVLI